MLRDACRLAVTVARDGEIAEPRVAAPPALRPLLTFRRLSATSYATIVKVIDEDEAFRTRVAATVPEVGDLDRAGWLWLHRPEGWASDPVWTRAGSGTGGGEDAGRLRRQQAAVEAKAARHEQAAAEAEEARRRAVEQLAEAREQAAAASEERDRLRARLQELEGERNRAVRTAKAVEADLAETRRDLKTAREATRQAEAELLARQDVPPVAAAAPAPARPAPPAPAVPPLDRAVLQAAVQAAATASAELADGIAQAAAASGALAEALDQAAAVLAGPAARPAAVPRGGSRRSRTGRPRRAAPTLPPGVFADSAEAHHHLITTSGALVVVDGYNLARTAWTGLSPEEERRRTVALLEEVQARSGGTVIAIFDGDDATVAPPASRAVRVRFSATGVTADDDIAALVAELPLGRPVVVVSSDREVADEARRQGAAVLSSPQFLAAAGR